MVACPFVPYLRARTGLQDHSGTTACSTAQRHASQALLSEVQDSGCVHLQGECLPPLVHAKVLLVNPNFCLPIHSSKVDDHTASLVQLGCPVLRDIKGASVPHPLHTRVIGRWNSYRQAMNILTVHASEDCAYVAMLKSARFQSVSCLKDRLGWGRGR